MAKSPLIGDPFPTLQVQTTHGSMTLPDDYSGRWFVLFSYPADFTPVCTTELVAFEKHRDEFRQIDTDLIGLSLDQVYAHIQWIEWMKSHLEVEITFPLIADDYGGISTVLGVIHPAKGTNTVRAVVIVDPEGTVRALMHYPQELGRNVEEVLRVVKGLQLSDKETVLIPADWPRNELIEDHVIVPPATDINTARDREDKYESYDWWFCHKKP